MLSLGQIYSPNHSKRNWFYALEGKEEQGKSTNVNNGNFLVFPFPVYALSDLGFTLSMVTPIVSSQFGLLVDIIYELFLVSSLIRDGVKVEWVYREIDGIDESPFQINLGFIRFKSKANKI